MSKTYANNPSNLTRHTTLTDDESLMGNKYPSEQKRLTHISFSRMLGKRCIRLPSITVKLENAALRHRQSAISNLI